MRYSEVGSAGLRLSRIGFGCGDNARLMVGDDRRLQEATVGRALACGITYFDTAAKYGNGRSETNLGAALHSSGADASEAVVGSKLLLDPAPERITPGDIRTQLEGTLRRLGRDRVELYQLHDRVFSASGHGWAPSGSRRLTVAEVLSPGGIAETLQDLRQEGLIGELGLTAYGGDPAAVAEVLASGAFSSINSSAHMLNPTALVRAAPGWPVSDYEGIAGHAGKRGLAVLAIRAVAGGRLLRLDQPPEEGRREADREVHSNPEIARKARAELAAHGGSSVQAALGWVLAWPEVTTVICGFSVPGHVDDACATEAGPPSWSQVEARAWAEQITGTPARAGGAAGG